MLESVYNQYQNTFPLHYFFYALSLCAWWRIRGSFSLSTIATLRSVEFVWGKLVTMNNSQYFTTQQQQDSGVKDDTKLLIQTTTSKHVQHRSATNNTKFYTTSWNIWANTNHSLRYTASCFFFFWIFFNSLHMIIISFVLQSKQRFDTIFSIVYIPWIIIFSSFFFIFLTPFFTLIFVVVILKTLN